MKNTKATLGEVSPFTVRTVPNEHSLEDILLLEKLCYPPEWQYPNAEEYYAEVLGEKSAIHIFLESDGKTVGYLLAVPLSRVYDYLVEHDADLARDDACYYLETIGIRPEYTGRGGGKLFMKAFLSEVQKRGIHKISTHARTRNGFNAIVRKDAGDNIIEARAIDHWYFGGGEPYEYIKWTI